MNYKRPLEFVKANQQRVSGVLVATAVISMTIAVMAPHVSFAGSPSNTTPTNGTQNKEMLLTEANQEVLDNNQPAPRLTYSAERANLIKKLNLTNNPNEVGYIYLLGANGQVVANYTVQGKVSSLNSLLTTPQQIEQCPGGNGACAAVTDSPDLDGSYGPNPDGVFFFTTSGAYVEWSGPYMYSDQPMNITNAVTLVAPAS